LSAGRTQTRVLGLLLKVCEAMAYAHDKRVIHRDLKPANVMVGRFGEVYVMDWGVAEVLARADRRDLRVRPETATERIDLRGTRTRPGQGPEDVLVTMDGHVVGTPAYMWRGARARRWRTGTPPAAPATPRAVASRPWRSG
jgi:serine/threonine protein kinase